MTPDEWSRVKVLFDTAVDLPAEEQAGFVATATAGDSAVQAEVKRLLAAERARATGFLDPQTSAPGSSVLEPHAFAVLQPGEVFAGRYEIQHELGRGGFGVVYAAFDRSRLQRSVALKVIRLASTDSYEATELARRRFFEEVRIAANLSHTNIAGVYEAGESGEWVYMTQELAPGRDLRRMLEEEGALPPQRAVAIARQLCAGLAHAHARGVVHRDIKPRNIIVSADDHVKVTDFGIAQPSQEDSPLSGALGGTLGYMAPEQMREGRVDGRADLFAVGCVLYEMLTGCRPFEGATTEIILDGLYPEPSRMRRGLPRGLDRMVTRALRRNPDERYGDIAQLQQALADYEESRRLWPAAIAAAALLLAIGAVFYFRYRHRLALAPRDTVVIADFIDRKGDPALAGSLTNALEAALDHSPSLSALSRDQVNATLLSMGRDSRTALTEGVAREVCQRSGGRAYIVGSITGMTYGYVFGLKAVSCTGSETLPEEQTRASYRRPKAELLQIFNDEAARLSHDLSESKAGEHAQSEGNQTFVRYFRRVAAFPWNFTAHAGSGRSGNPGPGAGITTTLAVTPTAAEFGSVFTLTASVRDETGNPLTNGSVTFYDGEAALGTVQVVASPSGGFAPGTATLKTFLATVGANTLTAKYTKAALASASAAVVATVAGKYPTTTTFRYDERGPEALPGLCAFWGTVTGAGPVTPSGEVAFMDTNSGSVNGRVNLDTATWNQTFASTQHVEGFIQPGPAAFADVNGDGFPDLIVTDPSGVMVGLGSGDGSFRPPQRATHNPRTSGGVALGDFDRDARIDLAVVASGQIRVFLGNGDGTFAEQGAFDSGAPGNLMAADFNGDGVLDLVATGNNAVDLLLGKGDGTFRPAVQYAVKSPLTLATGDVNRDGYSDVVVAIAPHDVTVLFGNPDGRLRAGATYSLPYQPASMLLADFRGTGELDLVTAFDQCCQPAVTSVNVMRGDGHGKFQPEYTVLSGNNYSGLAAGDFNGDGKLDLVVSDYGYPAINVLPGNGDGTFQSAVPYMVGNGPLTPAVADLNHDGRPDIAVTNVNFGDVYVLLNQVTQQLALYPAVVSHTGPQFVAARYLGDANFAPSTSTKRSFSGYVDNSRGIISPCPANRIQAQR